MILDKQKLDLTAAGLAATSWTLPEILSIISMALAIIWYLVRFYDRFVKDKKSDRS